MTDQHLKRDLGLLQATMLGVGGAISAGVFVTLGYAASLAGTILIAVMVLCGIINLFTMLSYAELGAAIPTAGGEYTFSKIAFGGFLSFTTGWFEWISNVFYTTFSSVGFAYLLSYVAPAINIPLTAIITIALFSLINLKGVKEMGRAQTVLMLILLSILAVFIILGFFAGRSSNVEGGGSPYGLLGVLRATAFVFVVYLGGEAIAGAQAEIKNPGKNIPRAIMLSCFVLISVYAAITFIIFKIVPVESLLNQASPLAYVAQQFMGPIGVGIITLAGIIASLTSVNTSIMAHSRVAYALARDGYLPNYFTNLHKRFATPYLPILAGGIVTCAFAATGLVNFFTYATDFGFIIGFVFVNLSLIKLRRTRPKLDRPFKIPLYPIPPILGLGSSIFLILFLEPSTLLMGLALFLFGVIVYYVRMVGYQRINAAVGGMNAGVGVFSAIAAYLLASNSPSFFNGNGSIGTLLLALTIIVSIVCLVAAALNFLTKKGG